MARSLRVEGAREHNLKGVHLQVPHDRVVAFTGPSGSGKSSLVFDTIYREAERRYLESFSAHARRRMARLARPDVDAVHGLRPAVALAQDRGGAGGPRSTVGTVSDIWASLRLLFARAGVAHCATCGERLRAVAPEVLIERLAESLEGRSVAVLAPVVDGHTGSRRADLERLVAAGCVEAWVDDARVPLDPLPELDATARHRIAGVLGDVEITRPPSARMVRLIHRALHLADGVVWILPGDAEAEGVIAFCTGAACTGCGAPTRAVGPRLFSFNTDYGACPACDGLGVQDVVDPELLVADPGKTLRQGALVPTTPGGYIVYSQVTVDALDTVCRAHGFSVDQPWSELSDEQRRVVLFGSDRLKVPFGKHPLENRLKWKGITARPREEGFYRGLVPTIAEILARSRNKNALRFARTADCAVCLGARLRPEALAVRIGSLSIGDCGRSEVRALTSLLEKALVESASGEPEPGVRRVLATLGEQCALLDELGVGYLGLARGVDSLSGGERQRLRLAGQLRSPLASLLYVLDEPTAGLHPADREALYHTLEGLRDDGASVFVVEHDARSMLRADWVVDVGPGAAGAGGEILFSGPPAELARRSAEDSLTAAALRALHEPVAPRDRRGGEAGGAVLEVRDATLHNLQGATARFPLGCLHAVTGVAGAGKSTLVRGVIGDGLRRGIEGGTPEWLAGHDAVDQVIEFDGAPIGRTPRSNPATYTGLADIIRTLLAKEPGAAERGLTRSAFSFNTRGGRCEECEGAGCLVLGMHGMAPHLVPCGVCEGRRFRSAVLEVRWRGLNVSEILELTVREAQALFADVPRALRMLNALCDTGLGYVRLGQPAPTLSGGEAQRMKLAVELAKPAKGHAVYLFDEPCRGLAASDVALLTAAIDRLVAAGHTVIAVEHHLDFIAAADRVSDLGPGPGAEGGRVLIQGTPEELVAAGRDGRPTPTGKALAERVAGGGVTSVADVGSGAGSHGDGATLLHDVRTHNLKGVHVSFPARALTAVTGLSGSGKSSLVYDTLHAEARRRFLSGLPSRVRRLLPGPAPAELGAAVGLTATVAVDQGVRSYGSRSTVGTLTEILEDLKIWFSRATEGGRHSTRAFSFHHPEGACPACEGDGRVMLCDPKHLVTDPSLPLWPEPGVHDGALGGTKAGRFYSEFQGQHLAILATVARELELDLERPVAELTSAAREIAFFGTGDRVYDVLWEFDQKGRRGQQRFEAAWLGLCGCVDEEYARVRGDRRGEELRPLLEEQPCRVCEGARLGPLGRLSVVEGVTLPDLCALPAGDLRERLAASRHPVLEDSGIGERVRRRLELMERLGVGHLSLDRAAAGLSGGEAQRVRLAGVALAALDGLTYVFDEPTLGLHPADVHALLEVLRELAHEGDSRVVVVEHDLEVIGGADHVIELGPQGGVAGGHVVFQGPVEALRDADTATGQALAIGEGLELSDEVLAGDAEIAITGARAHNLRDVDVRIPVGALTLVTGVSGSGKSSLVFDVLAPSLECEEPIECAGCTAPDGVAVRALGHGPLHGGAAQSPLTVLGLGDAVAGLFAQGALARESGLTKRHFRLTNKGGRCEECRGLGRVRQDLDFLGESWTRCPECRGRRFGPEALACTLPSGLDLGGLLDSEVATVAERLGKGRGLIHRALEVLGDLGLGYLSLGQGCDTLSGGEAQRLRLARELLAQDVSTKADGVVPVYLLDEPTTGLHAADAAPVLAALRRLVAEGATVVAVEHDLDWVAQADHVIDLGPGAGGAGGLVVATGTPRAVARIAESATGRELARRASGSHQ